MRDWSGEIAIIFCNAFCSNKISKNIALKLWQGLQWLLNLQAIACSPGDSMRTPVRIRRKYKEETIGIVLFAPTRPSLQISWVETKFDALLLLRNSVL